MGDLIPKQSGLLFAKDSVTVMCISAAILGI